MPKAKRTQAADRDLESIAYEIGLVHGRVRAAEQIIDELIGQCDRLAEFASTAVLGTNTPQLGEGVRLFGYKRWVIVFRYTPDGIIVLRIADGSQDYLSWELPPI